MWSFKPLSVMIVECTVSYHWFLEYARALSIQVLDTF